MDFKVSVIIPVYNAASFLENAIQSALKHPEVKEILIIDDGSKDHSLSLAQTLASTHKEIKVLQHPNAENRGAAASRNLGMAKATQEFIAFLDADDEFTDRRFEAEKQLFKDSKMEGVFGALGQKFLSENAKKSFQSKFKNIALTTVNFPAEGSYVFEFLLDPESNFGSFFHLNTLTLRRKSILEQSLWFNEKLRLHQDQDFITKLAYHLYLKTGLINQAVALRGVHDDNRITKIENYSLQYNQCQKLLWQSLDEWATEKNIKKELKEFINLKHIAFDIGVQSGRKKYIKILKAVLQNPKILKTRYRFHFYPKSKN